MSSINYLHVETEMLKVRAHSELLSAQNVNHSITPRDTPKIRMKKTLFARNRYTVEPMLLADDRKSAIQAIHTDAVNKDVNSQERNVVFDDCPPTINNQKWSYPGKKVLPSPKSTFQ